MGSMTARDLLDSSGRDFLAFRAKLGEAEFSKLTDKAVCDAIEDQLAADIDVITDGEQRRGHYIYSVVCHLGGFNCHDWEEVPVEKVVDGQRRVAYRMAKPLVDSEIEHQGLIFVEDYRYAQSRADRPVKVTVPGPSTVVDAVRNAYYVSCQELAFAYAKAIRQEVAALEQAGCTTVQFDDPGLMRDLERAQQWGLEALEQCFEGIGGITTIVHVCRSYPNPELEKSGFHYKSDQGYYPYVLDLVRESKIDQVSIEARSGALNARVLEHLGEKTVLLGCVDVSTEQIEAVDDIRRQAERALKHVHPGQLVLAPDCGLVLLSRDAAKGKLSHLARAAGQLNGNL